MKTGDILKLIDSPSLDWMYDYLDKTFEVVDFTSEDGLKLLVVDSSPAWYWQVSKENFVLK